MAKKRDYSEILGLNRNTLRKKIQDLGVEMTRGRR